MNFIWKPKRVALADCVAGEKKIKQSLVELYIAKIFLINNKNNIEKQKSSAERKQMFKEQTKRNKYEDHQKEANIKEY